MPVIKVTGRAAGYVCFWNALLAGFIGVIAFLYGLDNGWGGILFALVCLGFAIHRIIKGINILKYY